MSSANAPREPFRWYIREDYRHTIMGVEQYFSCMEFERGKMILFAIPFRNRDVARLSTLGQLGGNLCSFYKEHQ